LSVLVAVLAVLCMFQGRPRKSDVMSASQSEVIAVITM